MDYFLLLAACLCVVTALIHSYFGERRLITPLVISDLGAMDNPLAKQVLRFAWHWTSLLWLLIALYLSLAAQGNIVNRPLLLAIGFMHLVAGIADALLTHGRHIGWPPIVIIGGLVLISVF